jgi:hypothetical protein
MEQGKDALAKKFTEAVHRGENLYTKDWSKEALPELVTVFSY